jgi:hypothetical protein
MQRRTVTIACLVAVSLVISSLAPAAFAQQPPSGDWTAVRSLPNDEDISIKLKTGKTVRGEFLSATENELTITRKGKGESFAKDTIAQIYRLKRKAEKGKYAAIGAGIGAGTGLGIGLAKNSPPVDDGEIYPVVGTILGAGIGAISGLLFGHGKRKHVLIYQAP